MECREVVGVLAEYSAELLKPRQSEAVASHLSRCPGCAGEWKTLQAVMSLVEQHGALQPPPGLWNGVYNQITTEAPAHTRHTWWPRLWARPARVIGPAVAAAALAAAAWLYHSPAGLPVVGPEQADREVVGAMREHALASSDAIFADRAGLESLAVLASYETRTR